MRLTVPAGWVRDPRVTGADDGGVVRRSGGGALNSWLLVAITSRAALWEVAFHLYSSATRRRLAWRRPRCWPRSRCRRYLARLDAQPRLTPARALQPSETVTTMPTLTLRSTITSTLAVLRMDRGTAVLLGATTALGLAAVLPVAGLMGGPDRDFETRLEISTVQGDLLGLPWRDPRTPAGTQRQATTVLFGLLVGMAAATLGTGCITLVALVGARDAVRSSDDGVRRAVGASRKVIRRAALFEASVIAAIGAGVGSVLGARLGGSAATEWPGATMPYHPGVPVMLVLATGAVVILTALLPLIFARQHRLTEPDRAPRQIFGPAVAQFAASLAVLVTAALVGRYASSVASTGSIGSDAKLLQLASASRQAATLGPRYETLIERLNAASLTASLTSPGALAGLGTIAGVTTDCGDVLSRRYSVALPRLLRHASPREPGLLSGAGHPSRRGAEARHGRPGRCRASCRREPCARTAPLPAQRGGRPQDARRR